MTTYRFEEARIITFGYTNYRGEYAIRRVVPMKWYWGSTEYHPQPQWLMEGYDVEGDKTRDFAVQDMVFAPVKGAMLPGEEVRKPTGYGYPGVVAASFMTIGRRELRYVVEATGEGYEGMLHIFNPSQLVHVG